MPDFQPDGLVFIHCLLQDHELAGANFIHQPLVNVFLHDALAQFLANGVQFLVRVPRPGHANGSLAARVP